MSGANERALSSVFEGVCELVASWGLGPCFLHELTSPRTPPTMAGPSEGFTKKLEDLSATSVSIQSLSKWWVALRLRPDLRRGPRPDPAPLPTRPARAFCPRAREQKCALKMSVGCTHTERVEYGGEGSSVIRASLFGRMIFNYKHAPNLVATWRKEALRAAPGIPRLALVPNPADTPVG
jgi:hypothetical protein